MEYLEDYFTEAFITNRREKAIAQMSEDPESAAALARLKEAMNASKSLMEREYYAMKLVIEAKGYTDYPDVLKNLEITVIEKPMTGGCFINGIIQSGKGRKGRELRSPGRYRHGLMLF